MARTITEIQAAIIAAKEADTTLGGLTSTSRVAIWRLTTYVVAVAIHLLEKLHDGLRVDIGELIATKKPHTIKWYVMKAKQFQYGVGLSLPDDSDEYAVVPPVDESVLIIKQAAVVELTTYRILRVKVAKEDSSGDLTMLAPAEKTAFSEYMERIKDAGVRLDIVSEFADTLRLKLRIFYDPLVLTDSGARIDGTDMEPVKNALNAFLKDQPFNGLFVLNHMIAALTAVEGVIICRVDDAVGFDGSYPAPILHEYAPTAGYLRLDETYFDANIAYEAHGPI
jgi:hypothetical protein